MTKNMTKMTNSGTKGESLTKKHDIKRTAGERRGIWIMDMDRPGARARPVRCTVVGPRYNLSLVPRPLPVF